RPRAEARPAALGVSIAVIGGGSWGTALAIHAARTGTAVRLWAREREVVDGIRARRRSPWYLADIDVPTAVEPTTDLDEALQGATLAIIVVPSEFVATTLKTLPSIPADVPILSATKGLDPERHLRMSEVISERFPEARVAVLSGPTFAREVALARPTAAVIATRDDTLAAALQRRLGTREPRMIAAGARTVVSALALARRYSVTLPICHEVSAVLFEGKPPADALTSLLERPVKREDR